MAELKSALEIALEKSEHIKADKDLSKKLEKDKFINQIQGLVRRYIDQEINLKEITDKINKCEEYKLDVINAAIETLASTITLTEENKEAIEAITLLNKNAKQIIKNINNLREEFLRQVALEHKKITQIKISELKRRGIFGSSVLPNVEYSEEWKSFFSSVENEYNEKLASIKKALLITQL